MSKTIVQHGARDGSNENSSSSYDDRDFDLNETLETPKLHSEVHKFSKQINDQNEQLIKAREEINNLIKENTALKRKFPQTKSDLKSSKVKRKSRLDKFEDIKSSSSESSQISKNSSRHSIDSIVDRELDSKHKQTSFLKLRSGVPTFTGDIEKDGYDFKGWRDLAITFLNRVNATTSDKIAALKMSVRENAGLVLQRSKLKKVSDVFKILKPAYQGFKTGDQLFHIKQRWPKETVMQLIGRIHAEAKHAYVSQNPKHFDDLLMKVFRNALHYEIQSRIEDQHPRKLKDLTYLAHEVEQKIRKQVIAPFTHAASFEINNKETTTAYEIKGKMTALETQLKTVLDSINNLKNDAHRDYKNRYQSNNNNRYSPYENKNYNSKYRDNRDTRDSHYNNNTYSSNKDKRQTNRIKGNCYACNKPGHSFRDCRSAKPYQIREVEDKIRKKQTDNLNMNAVTEIPPQSQQA